MFPPMTPMGEHVRFQCLKELERLAQRPIHPSLVARFKALISTVGSGLWLLKNG